MRLRNAGYLDIEAALAQTAVSTLSAESPTAAYDPSTGNVYLVGNPNSVWGSDAPWGVSAVWGSNVFVSGSVAPSPGGTRLHQKAQL